MLARMEPAQAEPFTILDVLGDAWGSLRRTVWTHVGWNVVFVVLLLFCACGACGVMTPGYGLVATAEGEEGAALGGVALLLVAYAVLLALMLGMMALHQAVTLAITAADLRGQPVDLATALRAGIARVAPMTGAMILRLIADMVVWVLVMGGLTSAFVAAFRAGFGADDVREAFGAGLVTAFLVAYAASLAWMLVVRAVLGLSGPCVQNERLGPLAATRRSIALLAGRRMQHIGLRVVWAVIAIALYAITYAPAIVGLLLPRWLGNDLGALVMLLVFPYLLAWYFFALHLLSFDTVLEGAVHARLTRERTAADIADVFA
jgi:hypothetical protein